MKLSLRLGALTAAVALAGVGVIGVNIASADSGSAHTGKATATGVCQTSGSTLITYTVNNDWSTTMTVTASNNSVIPVGTAIAKTASKDFKQTLAAPSAGQVGEVTLSVKWPDGTTQSGITAAYTADAGCTGPTPVVAQPLTVAPPTCTAPGSLVGLSETRGQNASYEYAGYRQFISPAYTPGDAGTYNITIQKIGPNGQPGYPYGTTTTPASGTVYTLTVAPAIGYQTADSTAPCYNRPDAPPAKVTTSSQETTTCKTDDVLITTTTTTTPQVWDETSKTYIDGTAVITTADTTRPKTDKEKAACAIVTPPTDTPTPTQTPSPTPSPSSPTPSVSPTPIATTSSPVPSTAAVTTVKPTSNSSDQSLAFTGSDAWKAPAAFAAVALLAGLLILISNRMINRRKQD